MQAWRDAASRGAERRAKVRKCLVRAQNLLLAGIWEFWRKRAAEMAAQRRQCAIVIARLSQGSMARAFGGWRDAVSFQRHARSVMKVR